MRRAMLALPCLLAACGDPGGDYPALVPVETLLAPQIPVHAAAATDSPVDVTAEVEAAGATTRGRAAAVGGQALTDAELLARAAALRARAETLRRAEPGV